MEIKTIPLGMFGANCYLLTDTQKNAVLIDPADASPLLAYMDKNGLALKAILLTHGHFDHTWAVAELKEKTNACVVCHKEDVELLACPQLAAGAFGELGCPSCKADTTVTDGDKLTFGEMEFTFIHTPGHSKGSTVIVCEDAMFTGDTVFAGSVGRTDLYGGDMDVLMDSVRKLIAYGFKGKLYPGHGETTTLEKECRSNVYFKYAQKEV